MKLRLHVQEVREASDISRAVAGAKTWGAQALLQIAAPFFVQHRSPPRAPGVQLVLSVMRDARRIKAYSLDGRLQAPVDW